jgi:hypothetical protein
MDCGRRSGKTLLSCEILVSHLLDEVPHCLRPRYACAAPVQEQANEIFWDLLLDLIPEAWIPGGRDGPNISLSTRNIKIFNPITGQQAANIKVAGLDKPHRLEGKYLNGFVGSEWSDVKPGVFDMVIRPMLADYHGWYILEGVPKRQGIGSRWYRNLCERVSGTLARKAAGLPPTKDDYPDCGRWTWPAWDIMPPEEVKEAQATMDPRDFEEQYGAKWVNAGGGVWHAFTREFNVRSCEHRDGLPIIVGQDYNRTPMCWTLNHRIGDIFETFDELVMVNTDTEKALDELWRRWGHHRGGWQFYGDASARNRGTRKFSDYAIVCNDQRFVKAEGGRTCHYPPANPSHHDRFAAGNARLATADGQHRAFIDPHCTALIEDLEMRAYKLGTMELPKNEGGRGHACLVAGTMIETARGPIPIEQVQVGDLAWTRKGYRLVSWAGMTRPEAEIWRLTCKDGTTVEGTANHPFWIDGAEFTPMDMITLHTAVHQLSKGAKSCVATPSFTVAVPVVAVGPTHGVRRVYGLTVEDAHEYFANGILVKNSDAWSYPIYRIWPIRFNVGGGGKQAVIVGERSAAGGINTITL